MNKFKDEDGFWRIGSVEKTEDTKEWGDAKTILGEHLIAHPFSYHWMAFGWLDTDNDFIVKECTHVDIT